MVFYIGVMMIKGINKRIEKMIDYFEYKIENGKKTTLLSFFPIGPRSLKKIQPDIDVDKTALMVIFISAMLRRGTIISTAAEIETILEKSDSSISFNFDDYFCFMGVTSSDENLEKILKLAFDMLFLSKFDRKDFDEIKIVLKQNILEERQDTNARAAKILSRELYPKMHRNRILESQTQLKILQSLTYEDVIDFVKKYLKLTNEFKLIKVGAATTVPIKNIVRKALKDVENSNLDALLRKQFVD